MQKGNKGEGMGREGMKEGKARQSKASEGGHPERRPMAFLKKCIFDKLNGKEFPDVLLIKMSPPPPPKRTGNRLRYDCYKI